MGQRHGGPRKHSAPSRGTPVRMDGYKAYYEELAHRTWLVDSVERWAKSERLHDSRQRVAALVARIVRGAGKMIKGNWRI